MDEACQTVLPLSAAPILIMVISPRMVYSMLEWPRMRMLAQGAGFQVVTWRVQGLLPTEWDRAVHAALWPADLRDLAAEIPSVCSVALGRMNHFPYSRVTAHGLLHAWPIWGVLPDEAWLASLEFRREALMRIPGVSSGKSP
jgi:hypothetical protein